FDQDQRRQLALTHGLSAALESDDQLYLLYQPKIDLHSGKMVGVEALMRWKHPVYGEVPPMDFIPLISQTTLINPLTCWVIREAARAIQQFEAAGHPTVVSVNVTTTNLIDEAFYDDLLAILQAQQIEASLLEVECLEMEELLKDPRALNTLTKLRALGVRVALDDFGSGYSNLNYLRRIPADVIKLDRALISDIATDAGSRAIVFRLIQMLNHFGFEIVAEGIEDQPTVDLLKRYNCHTGQGYFFYRPLKLADAIEVGQAAAR
ncbi:EAL domain-containing protein, partial [Salinicola rhizosphaerae]|uniref:EAL domain-containing protein n=1 Tax=Salinicola rhizosphaerae TaxID=1443141 RepID=UPI001671E19C